MRDMRVDKTRVDKLYEAAKLARENAYSPYSKYKVGAAVQTKSGFVFTGCNVECVNFTSICAERSAIVNAVSAGHRDIETVLIVTATKSLAAPCGVCRQAIAEFNPNATIIISNLDKKSATYALQDLLPHAFTPKDYEAGQG